ncbi:MAG: LysM peptidoglycan-binding domain-containing protein [Anaerolineales bacterium]
MRRTLYIWLLISLLLSACTREAETPTVTPEGYNPFLPLGGNATVVPVAGGTVIAPTLPPTHRNGPTPTLAPFSVQIPPTRLPGVPILSPTPDSPRALPTPRVDPGQHIVQSGDTLGTIAQQYGVSLESLMQANGLADANLLSVGQELTIPAPSPGEQGTDFKIIPNSELVYGPASADFDVNAFIQEQGGYLSTYNEDVNGEILTGPEIITRVAQNYSVNPRLLLALLEHQSGWVTNSSPSSLDYPMGLLDSWHSGLYLQMTWSANTLNRGYYLWRANAISTWVLADGAVLPIAPTINAGTAGVQNFFANLDDTFTWQSDTTAFGLFQTYFFLFGNPFDFAIEPLVPSNLPQPAMQLPFEPGVIWSFTGGPHGGWDTGSAWAALDFGPPGEAAGCTPSDEWVVAVADGWIVRTGDGAVMQDLDGDGFEQTGWVVFYMHIESNERIPVNTYAFTGERIGHPSCEGGFSNGTHVHIARKYNGEWIAADGTNPFQMEGWVSSGNGIEYDGFLAKGDQSVEAWDGRNELNQIGR